MKSVAVKLAAINQDRAAKVTSISQLSIVDELGFGSFSRTWTATIPPMPGERKRSIAAASQGNFLVVLKEFDQNYVKEVCDVRCFNLFEQKLVDMVDVQHPNIIRTFHVFAEDNKLYQLQEYNSDNNLQGYIEAKHGRLINENRIRFWFRQIVTAVSVLHDKQILHCAIKPKNILLSSNLAVIKLSDGGTHHTMLNIAKESANEAVDDTLLHFPPEVFDKNAERSAKVDVWMMGVVIYQLATLELPFQKSGNKTVKETMEWAKPKPINDTIYSSTLRQLVDRMLVKDQTERSELREILECRYLRKTHWMTGIRSLRQLPNKGSLSSRYQVVSRDRIKPQTIESDSLLFHRDFMITPSRTLINAQSSVRAILPICDVTDPKYHSEITVICEDGQILRLQSIDRFESTHMCRKVRIYINESNPKDKFGVFHAVYDSKSDIIFVILISPHSNNIYYVKRQDILPHDMDPISLLLAPPVKLHIFTVKRIAEDRQFLGMAVDEENRLLYVGSDQDISVWSLAHLDNTVANIKNKLLVNVIRCDDVEPNRLIEPRYLNFSVLDGKTSLVVSDFLTSRLYLFFIDNASTGEVTCKTVISSKNVNMPLDAGSIYGPCELCFDPSGQNIYITEFSTKRMQRFSIKIDQKPGKNLVTARSTWMSDKIEGGPYRIAFVKTATTSLIAAAVFSNNDVVCFE